MSETPAPTPPPPRSPRPRSLEREAEAFVREISEDGLAAARRGWKMAAEIGSAALNKAEEVTDRMADDLRGRKRPSGSPPPPPPPPPPTGQP